MLPPCAAAVCAGENLILNTQDQDITTQGNLIKQSFKEWQGEEEQTDDVTIIGLELQ
ncbi:MAG: hypothetical protein JKY54_16740 [Flavobacteriales bacterium]|nr:hypothetical protein [Flavobacteriales bacterium]